MIFVDSCNRTHIDVSMLSLEDGRQKLVDTARSLCHPSRGQYFKHLTPSKLDDILQGKEF